MPNGEERHFLPPPGHGSFGGQYPGPEGDVPPREELKRLPKTVLLRVAIELDPDTVAESYAEGWTKEDILRVIERHLKSAIGNRAIEGWPHVLEVEIIDSEVELEDE